MVLSARCVLTAHIGRPFGRVRRTYFDAPPRQVAEHLSCDETSACASPSARAVVCLAWERLKAASKMASREKIERQRERAGARAGVEPHAVAGAPGTFELVVNTSKLPNPEREFYANAARVVLHDDYVTFVFAQMFPGSQRVQTEVAIEIPKVSITQIWVSLDDPFRGALLSYAGRELPTYNSADPAPNALSYPAHFAKLLITEQLGVLDFYALVPGPGTAPTVEPAIRIKAFPSIVAFFTLQCDLVQGETNKGLPSRYRWSSLRLAGRPATSAIPSPR